MKKSIFIALIILISFIAISCKSQEQSKAPGENKTVETEITKDNNKSENSKKYVNSPEDQVIFEENEEKDNTEVNKSYKEVDKSKLDYNSTYSSTTYYETQNSFVGNKAGIPNVDNKKYQLIFENYTYACEVNPTNVTYKDAIKLAKSVLPDEIKEIRKKYDSSTDTTSIIYSSSQGNFVLGLVYSSNEAHTDGFIPDSDKDTVVGINYMKEIV